MDMRGVRRQRASMYRNYKNRMLLRTDDAEGTNRKAGMFGDRTRKSKAAVKKVSRRITAAEYAAIQAKRTVDMAAMKARLNVQKWND